MSNKKTSPTVATTAAKALKNSNSKSTRQLAGSALSQSSSKNKTSKRLESLAGRVLNDLKSTKLARELAGCVLAQGEK